jgi:BMFP domain-containing protein YqiC
LVKMMNGAAGTIAGMTRETEGAMRDRMRDWIGGLDMVSRDELEAVKAIAVAAREEAQALRTRLEAMETAQAASRASGASSAASASSPRGRKSSGGAGGGAASGGPA